MSQNLLHFAAFGQFVHELVEIPGLLGELVRDLFDAVPTDGAGDEVRIGVKRGSGKELLEGRVVIEVVLEGGLVVPREPLDHLVKLRHGAPLGFHLLHVVRIDGAEHHLRDFGVVVRGVGHPGMVTLNDDGEAKQSVTHLSGMGPLRMARPRGLEPPTSSSGGKRSIH